MSQSRRAFLAESLAASAALAVMPVPGQETEEGFAPLADGRSLRGWVIVDGADSDFTVRDGAIIVAPHCSFPTWLRSARQYENFDFRGEFFTKGWTDSGIYLHAPEHGRPTAAGMQIKVFHLAEETPTPYSVGSIFPLVAPRLVNVRAEWNAFRILMDWPSIKVWINGAEVQDVNLEANPELKHRLRYGYLGIAGASTACRFRNMRIRELAPKESWTQLYEEPADLEKWLVSEGEPNFVTLGPVLRADGVGHMATKEKFRDFELHLYIRASRQHNGGVLFRSAGRGLKNPRHYEIQLHNVEEAHYPTGSLYHHKRAVYPRIEDEKWYLMQLRVQGSNCLVRINGDTVLDYDRLENLDEGFIELQAHRRGYWTEFKHIRVKRL